MWCSPQFFAEVASTSSMSQLKTFIPLIWSTQCSIHKYTYHLHSPSLPTNLPSSGTQPLTTSSRGFRIAMWAPQWIPEKPGCQTHVVAFGVKETPFRTMCCFYSCRSCSSDTLTLSLIFITLGEKNCRNLPHCIRFLSRRFSIRCLRHLVCLWKPLVAQWKADCQCRRFISKMRQYHSYYGRRIENCAEAFEWYHFQWPWVILNPNFKVTILF